MHPHPFPGHILSWFASARLNFGYSEDGWLPRKSRLKLTTFQKICSIFAKGKVEIQFLASLPNEFWIRKAFKMFSKSSRLCCRQSWGWLPHSSLRPIPWEVIGCQELLSSNCDVVILVAQVVCKNLDLQGFGEATDFGSKSFVLCFKSIWLMNTGTLNTHIISCLCIQQGSSMSLGVYVETSAKIKMLIRGWLKACSK